MPLSLCKRSSQAGGSMAQKKRMVDNGSQVFQYTHFFSPDCNVVLQNWYRVTLLTNRIRYFVVYNTPLCGNVQCHLCYSVQSFMLQCTVIYFTLQSHLCNLLQCHLCYSIYYGVHSVTLQYSLIYVI